MDFTNETERYDSLSMYCQKYELTGGMISTGIKITIIVNVVACFLLAVFCLLANIFILSCLNYSRYLRTPTHLLLSFLAVSDLLTGAISLPLNIVLRTRDYQGHSSCKLTLLFKAMSHVLGGVSGFTTVLIGVHPFVAMHLSPLQQKLSERMKTIYKVIFILICVVIALFLSLWIQEIIDEKIMRMIAGMVIGCMIVLLAAIYFRVFCVIKMARRTEDVVFSRSRAEISRVKQQQCLKTVSLLLFCFILCYLPRMVFTLTFTLYKDNVIMVYHLQKWTAFFAFLNSGIDPVIYFCRLRSLRLVAAEFFREMKGKPRAHMESMIINR